MQGATGQCEQMPDAMEVWDAVEGEEDRADGIGYAAEDEEKKCM